jgi:hypothetical protein
MWIILLLALDLGTTKRAPTNIIGNEKKQFNVTDRFFYISKEMCTKETYKVYSGSHFFPNISTTIFIASFKDSIAPSSASVYVDGTKHALTVDTGDESKISIFSSSLIYSDGYLGIEYGARHKMPRILF